ncbi:MAG: fatty acid desaturase family protein [Acidobacteriota bacterium]
MAAPKQYSESPAHRYLELAAIAAWMTLSGYLALRIAQHAAGQIWVVLFALVAGLIASDFFSGLVHWLADTWGSPQTPLLGRNFIDPFRQHHVDQIDITRHDFVETNGNNCLVSLPVLLLACQIGLDSGSRYALFAVTFMDSVALWVFATNQFHKWAHHPAPPAPVRALQRMGLILNPEHHSVHHASPFAKYYCITTGWMNAPLTAIDFFPRLERLITALTGMQPRQDDLKDRGQASVVRGQ